MGSPPCTTWHGLTSAHLIGSGRFSGRPGSSSTQDLDMKISGSEVRQGYVIEWNGKLFRVAKAQPVQLGNWRSYVQVELRELAGGTKLNERIRPDDTFEKAMLEEKEYQFLYKEGDQYTFMDNETYDQIALNQDDIGDAAVFLQDGMKVSIQFHESKALSVALPDKVTMAIVEADPVVKGQTASSSYKPAKLENGVRIMVPPHIAAGTRVVVNTADASYVERAKD
jgi:elongation factor P